MAVLSTVLEHASIVALCISVLCCISYVVYQRYFHPLAKYPGPFLASITDLWQVYQFMTLKQPYTLTELHEKYGSFVRYGPDKLSTTCEDAVALIYQKGGRSMPKTEFYDAYGAAHPNVFGMRDEALHSIRRRHMSHSFSISYVKEMEQYLDTTIAILKQKLARYASTGEVFDLKKAFHYYVIDTLGELAFSQSFGVQQADDESLVPPVKEHSLLAAATGAWPAMRFRLKRWLPLVPYKPLQDLFRGRQACADLASRCVQKRLRDLADIKDDESAVRSQRKDILTSLILAKHPDTGERLTEIDLETEAFGFIIAGTHTTSATTTLLFYHLLHNPGILSDLVSELDNKLPPLEPDQPAHSITLLESSLSFLRDCVKENFRINPVFTMPLARRVTAREGIMIDGEHIPRGTSIAICNHAFHHNPAIWGSDHNTFRPSRWTEPANNARSRLLMHFGLGGRQCIGKTIATTNIYKLTSSLLQDFDFELMRDETSETLVAEDMVSSQRNDVPRMVSVGISDLEAPLMVKCRRRAIEG
ncbi:hypothetical protein H2198_000953 [Neophaeococcomyces mojaviensis]|uniref:Uncharacterized protein n=1 Tax=Neophaeococcomyces mojaviensis TaxID=3383035 RepID=A0ACC3AIF0_9EURO|nr:hypothetical protein H2198_000953 [Knufia sp. JES_112]